MSYVRYALNILIVGKQMYTREKHGLDTMKAVLQWRWIIIDENRLVSARFLADVDQKLRFFGRGVGPYARNHKGIFRPFAGIQVLCSGDLATAAARRRYLRGHPERIHKT